MLHQSSLLNISSAGSPNTEWRRRRQGLFDCYCISLLPFRYISQGQASCNCHSSIFRQHCSLNTFSTSFISTPSVMNLISVSSTNRQMKWNLSISYQIVAASPYPHPHTFPFTSLTPTHSTVHYRSTHCTCHISFISNLVGNTSARGQDEAHTHTHTHTHTPKKESTLKPAPQGHSGQKLLGQSSHLFPIWPPQFSEVRYLIVIDWEVIGQCGSLQHHSVGDSCTLKTQELCHQS